MKSSILAITTICVLALQGWGTPLSGTALMHVSIPSTLFTVFTANVVARDAQAIGTPWKKDSGKYTYTDLLPHALTRTKRQGIDVLAREPQFTGPPWKKDAGTLCEEYPGDPRAHKGDMR